MDWKRAMAEERAALGRIVALLCALADLAERASGRSAVVRTLVLWLLRHAEEIARDFVEGCPYVPSASMPIGAVGSGAVGSGPGDAVRLAISLRALARQLDEQARLLATVTRAGGETAASRCGRVPAAGAALVSLSGLAAFALGAPHAARALDTS